MDLGTMRTAVRARIGELEEDFWTDTEVDEAINEGQRRFLSSEKWPWLYTVRTDVLPLAQATLQLVSGVEYTRDFNIMLSSGSTIYPLLPIKVDAGTGFRIRRRWAWAVLKMLTPSAFMGHPPYCSKLRMMFSAFATPS